MPKFFDSKNLHNCFSTPGLNASSTVPVQVWDWGGCLLDSVSE